ncbi:MAG: hypothetical protein KAH31_00005, partial [Candidatus Sabulitectum sp.]|nr:hypothetical protein [Candidatus Sabulitectum sp.]
MKKHPPAEVFISLALPRGIEPRFPSLVNWFVFGDAGYEKTPPCGGVYFFGAPTGNRTPLS